MFVFDTNGRVQKVTEGILFYEQDILCSSYIFSGDQKIELNIDYVMPGFGIAMIDNSDKIASNKNAFLFKLGVNDFKVFEQNLGQQLQKSASTCIFEPGVKNAHLTFNLQGKKVSVIYNTVNSKNETVQRTLGEYRLNNVFDSYKIGFYSNAGNVIKNVTFWGAVPQNWKTSTINTIGGRISFSHNAFTIENCDHEAELEQKNILLQPGKYWLKYDKEPVNGTFDISPYVFFSDPTKHNEDELEDDKKNILQEGNVLQINKPANVTLKFKGHNGRVKNLSLSDTFYAEFVETEGAAHYQEGSAVKIRLEQLTKVDWTATVRSVPEWDNLTKKCPYGILALTKKWYSIADMGIELKHEYKYSFDVSKKLLIVKNENGQEVFNGTIPLSDEDQNTLVIMNNVTMVITNLILTFSDGSTTNVILQRTFKHYVPGSVESPIIVTKNKDSASLDLSASYREVVLPKKKIKFFSKEAPLFIKEDIPVNAKSIKVYGIPAGNKINLQGKTIQDCVNSYILIPNENYSFSNGFCTLSQYTKNSYEYIAIEYNSIEEYTYEFTNYEREIFSCDSSRITLSKLISQNNNDIIVYGIPKNTTVHSKNLYRVPDAKLINSIDYYADDYEQLDASNYSVDYNEGQIKFNSAAITKYNHLVVDYLKHDSYTINYRNKTQQYEVDVSTDAKEVYIHYDMHDDGSIGKFIKTDIELKSSAKYIVLKRKEDFNED